MNGSTGFVIKLTVVAALGGRAVAKSATGDEQRLSARHGRGIGRRRETEEVGLRLGGLLSHEGDRREERHRDPHSENTPSA